ncbi:MAG TPA: hypothetical protein VMT58_07290 [Candidatus Binataceae bacterium]|nr:hypothetical protein [Candidatus Binataceae bacterium]
MKRSTALFPALLLIAAIAGCRGKSAPTRNEMAFAAMRLCNEIKAQPYIPGLPVEQQDSTAAGAVARDTAKRYGLTLQAGADVMTNLLKGRRNETLAQFVCGSPSFSEDEKAVSRLKLNDSDDPLRDDERQVANGCAAAMQYFQVPHDTSAEICAADLMVRFPVDLDRAASLVQWASTTGAGVISPSEKQAALEQGCKMVSESIKNPNQANIPKEELAAHRAASSFAIAAQLDIALARADVIYLETLQSLTEARTKSGKAMSFKDAFCGPS